MFETAVVRGRAADRRLLVISLIGHSAIVVAIVAASVASTRLPEDAPRQMIPVFFPAPIPAMSTPAPQPRPAAPPKGSGGPAQAQPRVLAPQVIPDSIPSVTVPATGPASLTPSSDDIGDRNGKENSSGSDPNAQPGPAVAAGPYVPGIAGVTSPVVISRVEPVYPRVALNARMNGWVVLQCIIDKTGHIRDVQILHSSFGAFEQPAIDAVRQWVFSPGQLNGQPVDVIFELTVKFQVR